VAFTSEVERQHMSSLVTMECLKIACRWHLDPSSEASIVENLRRQCRKEQNQHYVEMRGTALDMSNLMRAILYLCQQDCSLSLSMQH